MSKNKFKSDSRFAILIDESNNGSKDKNGPKDKKDKNVSKDKNGSKDNREPIYDLEKEKELNNNEENIFKNDNKTKKPKTISHQDNVLVKEKEIAKKEEERNNKEIVKRKQDEKSHKVLSIENFPELTLQEPQVAKDNDYVSFLDKIKLEKIENEKNHLIMNLTI